MWLLIAILEHCLIEAFGLESELPCHQVLFQTAMGKDNSTSKNRARLDSAA